MTKRIIVTGASSGIGRATALALAAPGHELVVAARRQQLLLELKEECSTADRVHTVVCDLANFDECRALIEEARRLGGPCEPVLVNSAGVAEFGDFSEMSVLSLESQIQTNLLGPLYLCREVIPWMVETGGGQIVNVLSVAATHVFPGAVAYSAAKAGLLAAGRSLAAEYRHRGVRLTSILPGATDTPIWGAGGPDRADMLTSEAVAQTISGLIALPRDRNVDEITLMPPKGIL